MYRDLFEKHILFLRCDFYSLLKYSEPLLIPNRFSSTVFQSLWGKGGSLPHPSSAMMKGGYFYLFRNLNRHFTSSYLLDILSQHQQSITPLYFATKIANGKQLTHTINNWRSCINVIVTCSCLIPKSFL